MADTNQTPLLGHRTLSPREELLVKALEGVLRAYDFGEQFPPDHPIVAARAALSAARK